MFHSYTPEVKSSTHFNHVLLLGVILTASTYFQMAQITVKKEAKKKDPVTIFVEKGVKIKDLTTMVSLLKFSQGLSLLMKEITSLSLEIFTLVPVKRYASLRNRTVNLLSTITEFSEFLGIIIVKNCELEDSTST